MSIFSRDLKKKRIGKRGEVLPERHEGLPDSHRPGGLCPRCGKQSSFDDAGSLPATFDETHTIDQRGEIEPVLIDRVSSLICRHCKQGVVVVEERWTGEFPSKEADRGGIISWRGIHWWPIPEANLSDDIPKDIAGVMAEAAGSLYANCPRASAVMSRRALEAICVDKGESKGSLADRLDALKKNGILLPDLAEWATEVRLVGNIGAHVDPMESVSMDDAKHLLSFVRELLKYLYELRAQLERRRADGKP